MDDNQPVCGQGLWTGRLITFASLPSTNQWVLDHAPDCQHGDVVRAISQTDGRGRLSRRWMSPGNGELTLSVVIRPGADPLGVASLLGPAVALGTRACLDDLGLPAELKWPNDVLVGGRKIAGILAERDLRTDVIAVGLGLNVNLDRAGLDAARPLGGATSIALETGCPVPPDDLLPVLLEDIGRTLQLAVDGQRKALAAAWAEHDALIGRRIRISTADGLLDGQYHGMTADGALRLLSDSGVEHVLFSGDVSLFQVTD